MLYVVMRDGLEVQWHVGEKFKPVGDSFIDEFVKFVYVDGDELEFVRNQVSYFPMPYCGSFATFFGDHAKFIVANVLPKEDPD